MARRRYMLLARATEAMHFIQEIQGKRDFGTDYQDTYYLMAGFRAPAYVLKGDIWKLLEAGIEPESIPDLLQQKARMAQTLGKSITDINILTQTQQPRQAGWLRGLFGGG